MRLKFIFTLAIVCSFIVSELFGQQTAKITSSGIGYLEYLPSDYNKNSNDYPIVIFLHGIGERGTTSTDPTTLKNSVLKVANVGLAKYVKYGQQYPFILISPQLKSSYATWPANYVMDVFNHVKKYLRIDERRIYITGLSLGGYGTWTTLGAYPHIFAAAVPICSGGNALSKACAIAAENVALWAFHGTADKIVSYTKTTSMINAVNACTPKPSPLAKTTLFSGLGHSIWDKVYKETNAVNWMLGFTNGTSSQSGSTSNVAPVVSAGADKTITLPTNEVYIQGTGTDSDGTITYVQWTKVSGPSASLGNAGGYKLRAYNLVAGTYTFRLTIKDNDGATRYDDVVVTVNGESSTSNTPPVMSAGPDITITLPTNQVYIQGSATDSDGKITYVQWSKLSGPSASLGNVGGYKLNAYNLVAGTYYFRLTVKDNEGATRYDDMKLAVNSSSTSNIAPAMSAGPDKTISLPTNKVDIQGSATDSDGRITYVRWTKLSGPSASLSNVDGYKLHAYNLVAGTYYFRFTVKDNVGATRSDDMKLTVNGTSTAYNIDPVANAGPDKRVADVNSLKVYGSGSDKDGDIVSYKWTQYGGPDVTLQNSSSRTLTVSGLDEGKYYLKLTVKDNDGAVDSDNMLIVVNES